ncbi:unnamed protein product [Lactuca saligna]|uniref:CCHC-type domain-containing protein n=1 Tax=Lactuca saligna TaxID=75948 RepID=A0AA35Y0G4_LACSI|nr:unnamed protein product [Lactuca saligna]
MPGRLATKRKKSITKNTTKYMVSKVGKKTRCSICKEIGHTKATCPQRRPQKLNVKRQKKQKGSRSEPQQHEEVEMTLIEMDTTQNDMQVTPNDVESNSARDFSQSIKVTPPRSYEGDEGVVGEEVEEGGNVVPIIQVQQVRVRPISEILKKIRSRKLERILKLELGKRIGGVDDPGNSKGKALLID